VSLAGIGLLYAPLFKLELTAKHAHYQLKALRRMLEDEVEDGSALRAPLATVPGKAE